MDNTQSIVDNSADSSKNSCSNGEVNQSEINGKSYLLINQSSEKLENMFPFLFFSETESGWFCRVCREYGKRVWILKYLMGPITNFQMTPKILEAQRSTGETSRN